MMRVVVGLAALLALDLGFGLLYTFGKNIAVAPWAEDGARGRLHFHTKNTTRLGGSAGDVATSIRRAVFLEDESVAATPPPDWRDAIRTSVHPQAEPRHVVVLASDGEDAARWSLPGAYWAAYAESPVVFAGRDRLPAEAATTLRNGLPIYVLAPEQLVSDAVLDELRAYGEVTRVAGRDLPSHAVRLAEFRDERTGFGWGRTHDRRTGYFEYVIAAPVDAAAAWAALPLAISNAAAFLFAADDGGVPAATDRYVWAHRADWFVTPSEGPFRHIWIVGDRVSYAAQGRLDLAPERRRI